MSTKIKASSKNKKGVAKKVVKKAVASKKVASKKIIHNMKIL
jgi:predicted GNAT family acetyltransferase